MKRKQKIKGIALLCVMVMLLSGCGSVNGPDQAAQEPVPSPGITLWMQKDAPIGDGLAALIERYNSTAPDSIVSLEFFESEDAMREALAGGRPDLLLCTQEQMQTLDEAGALCALAFDAENMPQYLAPFTEPEAVRNLRYVPLCASLPVLVCREESRALYEQSATLEDLFAAFDDAAAQQGKPVLAIDDCAVLFAAALAQRGERFSAELELEKAGEAYREIYNLLADAVFDGALLLQEERDALALVEHGVIDCALCTSSALAALDSANLSVLPVPPMAGCQKLEEAEIWGLAVMTTPERLVDAAAFVGWLCQFDLTAKIAIPQGLIPVVHGKWERDETGLSADFCRVADACDIFLKPGGEAERAMREQFEHALYEVLAALEEPW
ncbi:MAG: extracellular solute-binding protein [Oscillospiraceae bacterium]|nr:extracellular solute-binding protein [Oscillospiraceae bacterium]